MSQTRKYTILVVLVVLPVFIFLFLQRFGQNHYNLRVFYPQDSSKVNGEWKVNYHTIPPFQFKDQQNNVFSSESLKGKIYVVDFFFTRCGDASFCPRMSAEMKRVQEHFKKNLDIEMLSFTVDPYHDTPKVLKEYATRYGAIDHKWHFLTGKRKKIYELAVHGFKVPLGEQESVTPDFVHTSRFILVDRQGRVRGYYDGREEEEIDKLMLEIKILRQESS